MPSVRWLVALACAGLLLAACGQPEGVLIGVRPHTEVAAVTATFDSSVLAAAINAQLAEYDQLAPIEDSLARGELPLDSTLTLKQRERLATLQEAGFSYIKDRLDALAGVRGQVVSDPSMQSWQKGNLMALLDGASATLSQLRVKIERDLLVDQARADVARIPRLRVYGLLLPEARLLMTGYQLQRLAVVYARQRASLQQAVNTAQANGRDVTVAQRAVNDIAIRVNTVSQESASGLAQLQGLSVAGYPGNKPYLLSARRYLTAGKFASDQAARDVAAARAALGL